MPDILIESQVKRTPQVAGVAFQEKLNISEDVIAGTNAVSRVFDTQGIINVSGIGLSIRVAASTAATSAVRPTLVWSLNGKDVFRISLPATPATSKDTWFVDLIQPYAERLQGSRQEHTTTYEATSVTAPPNAAKPTLDKLAGLYLSPDAAA